MIETNRKYFHPGVVIKDAIEEMGLNQTEFALRSGLSIKNVSTLISGDSNVTIDVAIKLAAFFHNSPEGWVNLRTKYDLYRNSLKEQENQKEEWKIAQLIDKTFLEQILNIHINAENKEKNIAELRLTFNVGTLVALKQPDMYAFCKTSSKRDLTETNIIMRNAWISIAESEAKKIKCDEFNKSVIFDNMLNLRRLTLEQPKSFQSKLKEILAKAGIKLVILPYLKNSLVGGVTKWVANENCVIIAVNDCGKDADKIWFSIFHELGHAMKNHKRHLTISYEKNAIVDEDEVEANKFASDLLINPDDYEEFVRHRDFTESSIARFAKNQQVADFIVIGRLQKDKYVPWSKFQYRKVKYQVLVY